MKRLYRYIVVLTGTAFLSSSCTEIIDIELDSTFRHLVVFGSITTDSTYHQVQLTGSSDYFSNMPPEGISQALVELEYEGRRMVLEEQVSDPGRYVVQDAFRGTPGTTYHLYISGVDMDSDGISERYSASATMPDEPGLDSIRLDRFQSPFVSGYRVMMYAQDQPGRDWYNYKLWKNSDLLTDTLSKYLAQSDDLIDGTYIYGFPVGFLRDDLPREALETGDSVTFEMNGIEKAFYDFILDAQLEIMGNNPLFSGPPANIRSNLDNGAMGVFTAYSIKRYTVILEVE